MAKKRGKRVLPVLNQYEDTANPIGSFAACVPILFGLVMLIVAYARGYKCKMQAIDQSSWNDPGKDGNLVKWFKYDAILLIIRGILTSAKACPDSLQTCCPRLGTCITNIMTGCCGLLVLYSINIVTFLCNCIGYFWLYLASQRRSDANSQVEGAINYCAPEIWYTAQVVVNTFWLLTALEVILTCGKIHNFFRSDEARRRPLILGYNKTEKKRIMNNWIHKKNEFDV